MADRTNVTNSGETKDGARFVVKKDLPAVQQQHSKFNELLRRLKTFPLGNTQDDNTLASSSDKITSHTISYLNKMKNTTGDDITRFLNKTLQNNSGVTSSMMGIRTAEDLFNNDSNNFSAFFFERYKNVNTKYEDLRIITEYLYELEEAVTTMRDSITGADDLVTMISREISFENDTDPNGDESGQKTKSMNTSVVESIEKKYKLKEKIKQQIIPDLLTYGNFYVYTIPYKEIFAQFEYRKKIDIQKGIFRESTLETSFEHPVLENVLPKMESRYTDHVLKPKTESFSPVVESIVEKYNASLEQGEKKITAEQVRADLTTIMEGIEICNDDYVPFMESSDIIALSDNQARDEALKAYRQASTPDRRFSPFMNRDKTATDAVVDIGEPSKEDRDMYKDIPGVYIKLYDPMRVIPIFVMDVCTGYYVLYETFGEIRNTILLNSSLNRANLAFTSIKRKELDDEVISVIADAICHSIDKKYVTANPKFRELIVSAISYQEFYKRKFKVQFIPVNYMTHFRVNIDNETHMGVSVLNKSLFYAKLYLSILLFKIITILTKSNDMRVYYIRNAGVNKNLTNRVQEIARSLKERQISFNDLASIQTIFSKVGTYKEAFIPMGKSGEKNIEFDILSGQDVQLNTDLMEMLKKSMIMNSGVPAVLSSLMEEADFSRTIVMQHSKYLARIIALQTETEEACTEMYQKILSFEGGINEEAISTFKFNFVRPKALNAQNMGELTNNADGYADFIVKSLVDENDTALMGAFKRHVLTNILLKGVISWDQMRVELEKVKMQMKLEKKEKELSGSPEEGQ